MTDPLPAPLLLAAPACALAIGAHPDDIEFGAGATLAQWADAGTDIHLLVLTDGSKGTWNTDDDLGALVRMRGEEARAAASALGNGTVHFGGFVDGELESDRATRLTVCRTIRTVRPNIVLGHDPWQRYRLHPDHRHAGWSTIDGLVAARDPHFFPGVGGKHHRPDTLLLFEADEPNYLEPIELGIDAKIAALLCHRSQWRSTMNIDPEAPDLELQRRQFADRVMQTARRAGDGEPAEAFRLLTDL